jgi:hypothetical protein
MQTETAPSARSRLAVMRAVLPNTGGLRFAPVRVATARR